MCKYVGLNQLYPDFLSLLKLLLQHKYKPYTVRTEMYKTFTFKATTDCHFSQLLKDAYLVS